MRHWCRLLREVVESLGCSSTEGMWLLVTWFSGLGKERPQRWKGMRLSENPGY